MLSISKFDSNKAEFIKEMHFPNSIGLYYSAFTFFCGFRVNSGEYKLMGLAPFGVQSNNNYLFYVEKIKSELVTIYGDGSIELNMKYFNFDRNLSMFDLVKVEKLLNLKRRTPEAQITQDYCDLALAVQHVLEEIVLKLCEHAKELTSCENLCLAGGVALNCVANSKIQQNKIFKNIWIHPAAGDAGGALGGALAYYYTDSQYIPDEVFNPYLGPSFTDKECLEAIEKHNLHASLLEERDLYPQVADHLANAKVVGWFQGRVEWGPRALGNRSILADARNTQMQQVLNLKIKYRESFRPFAPIILEEEASDYFDDCSASRYMLFTHQVKSHLLKQTSSLADSTPEERVKQSRSSIPSITHMDNSARVQTVTNELNPKLYELLLSFKKKTGSPILINTSFNVRGEPIVCTPLDAINCFLNTEMDILVLNNFVITK